MGAKAPGEGNKDFIPRNLYHGAIAWCEEYPDWLDLLESTLDTSHAIRYDLDKVQTSGDSDPTAKTAIMRAKYSRNKDILENTVREVAPEIYPWMLKGITQGLKFDDLKRSGIPCSDKYFYIRRRQVYCLIVERKP